jgi:hypothetical protein
MIFEIHALRIAGLAWLLTWLSVCTALCIKEQNWDSYWTLFVAGDKTDESSPLNRYANQKWRLGCSLRITML